MDHTVPTDRPPAPTEYKNQLTAGKATFYPFASASLPNPLQQTQDSGKTSPTWEGITNTQMLGKLRELHALTLTQMDTAK